METVKIYFVIELTDPESTPSGPLFHRWLPNGREDAVALNTDDSDAELKVWFRRRGTVTDGKIEFDMESSDIDPNIMSKQAKLDAGPLSGELTLTDVPESQVTALKTHNYHSTPEEENDDYKELGKRVVKLIYRPISRFLQILHDIYGQYWLSVLECWDSRKQSLGTYCRKTLHAQWEIPADGTCGEFVPTPLHEDLTLTMVEYEDYLNQDDWWEIDQLMQDDYQPDLSAELITNAHRLANRGNLRHALVEAVSALEISIKNYLQGLTEGRNDVQEAMKEFHELNNKAKLVTLALSTASISHEDIEDAVNAVEVRNDIVHEGMEIPDDHFPKRKNELYALLQYINNIMYNNRLRFPDPAPGRNQFYLDEQRPEQ